MKSTSDPVGPGAPFERRLWRGVLVAGLPLLVLGLLLLWLGLPTSELGRWSLTGLLLLSWLWGAAMLRQRVVFPLYTLSNLLEALREGDFSLRGTRAHRGDAMGDVVWEVNALAQTLREQRLQVEETLYLLTKVLANVDFAVLAFDAEARLKLANPAAERLLGIRQGQALGQGAESLGVDDVLAGPSPITVRRSFPGGAGSFEVRRAEFRQGGLPNRLLVITDLSRALREEERQTWQRLIRVLGHELNNSLAPIKSMASTLERLCERVEADEEWHEDVQGGLALIGSRAQALSRFMTGYTALARLPPPDLRSVELGPLLERLSLLDQRLPVQFRPGPACQVEADPDQLEQALINLLKNAVDATAVSGGRVSLSWQLLDGAAEIEILDEGPGLSQTENLFVPFFTTKPGGSGIGLVLARQIAEAHGGWVNLVNRDDGQGCRAVLGVPLAVTDGD
ncbi:MAG: histidine kinase [Xanthomonadales bacterium]|nr:histidine kinase [Xanthomonadales bacterium]